MQQSDDFSDHYLVLCIFHKAKAVKPTPCYKHGRNITSTTKDWFINNPLHLSYCLRLISVPPIALFSSTLHMVSPLRLRNIKEIFQRSPTPWYNEQTLALKRAARKMERSWRKTKLEVFRIAW